MKLLCIVATRICATQNESEIKEKTKINEK